MLWFWYGDQVSEVTAKPFSVIRANLELASNNKDATSGSVLNARNIRGNLGGWGLGDSNQPNHHFAGTMENVDDEITAECNFADTAAAVIHRNFVHHGSGRLRIVDAVGDTIYNSNLEWSLDLKSRGGVPGRWKAIVGPYGARGRVDVRIQALGAPVED